MQEIIKRIQTDFADIVAWFRGEVASLRTGRATPALVEDIEVEQYGTKQPLKHIASLSTPDPRTILIQPWDRTMLEAIGKAIESSSLHVAPVALTDSIRVVLPQLTEERRRDLLKLLNAKAEEARMRSRKRRDEAWKEVQQAEKDKILSEDEKFRAKDALQKCMDDFNASLEEARGKKEQEVMAV